MFGNKAHLSTRCEHSKLSLNSSAHANEAGYHRPTSQQRATAAGKTKKVFREGWDASFPAPLVLPGDELSMDPRCPPQSLRSWVREKERNEVTAERNIIYVAGAPDVDASVDYVRTWTRPKSTGNMHETNDGIGIATSGVQLIADYLAAFYHGMPVKLLPPTLRFTAWEDNPPKRKKQKTTPTPKERKTNHIGLTTATETIRIRTRPLPDGIFAGQLNLNDLLDVAISILPTDAYALLMLVDQDLYEDDDDDFCCGRAYGGSRIAVVGAARYNPVLDERQGVERGHVWPASHCEDYIDKCSGVIVEPTKEEGRKSSKQTNPSATHSPSSTHPSPLHSALSAHPTPLTNKTPTLTYANHLLWLPRLAQTASHELGHCFGLDHCTYYACVMQATASIKEDLRQPPYLCPVDEAKVGRATGKGGRERGEVLGRWCGGRREFGMFAALGGWVAGRVGEMGGEREEEVEGEGVKEEGVKEEDGEPERQRGGKVGRGKGSRKVPIELSP